MKNVINILTNDSNLTSLLQDGADSIYIGKAAQWDRPPFVIVDERLVNAMTTMDSTVAEGGQYEYRIFSFANHYAECKAVSDAIIDALDNIRYNTTGGETLYRMYLDNTETDAIKENNINYYMIETRFLAFITK